MDSTNRCIDLCRATEGCRYWTVSKFFPMSCRLKGWKGRLKRRSGFISGSLPSACCELSSLVSFLTSHVTTPPSPPPPPPPPLSPHPGHYGQFHAFPPLRHKHLIRHATAMEHPFHQQHFFSCFSRGPNSAFSLPTPSLPSWYLTHKVINVRWTIFEGEYYFFSPSEGPPPQSKRRGGLVWLGPT